MYHEGGITVIV